MTLYSEIKVLSENLEALKNQITTQKTNTNLFNALEIRKGSASSRAEKGSDPKANFEKMVKSVSKKNKTLFRVTFLKDSIQFLDLKSILNLSMVCKEFSFFIKSIYFYKFISKLNTKSKSTKKVDLRVKEKYSTPTKGGLFSSLIGSVTSALGFSTPTTNTSANTQVDIKLFNEKLSVWETILKTKLKNFKISQEIKSSREQIDILISERNFKKEPVLMSNHIIIKDKEIEQIKRDKAEKEYTNHTKEVKALEEEVESLKVQIKQAEDEEIEKEKILKSLKIYINSNLRVEDIKITPDEKLKSSRSELI